MIRSLAQGVYCSVTETMGGVRKDLRYGDLLPYPVRSGQQRDVKRL